MIPATKKPPAGARVWMAPKRTDASAVPALKFKGSGRNEAKHNAWEPIDYLVGCEGLITENNNRKKVRVAELDTQTVTKRKQRLVLHNTLYIKPVRGE